MYIYIYIIISTKNLNINYKWLSVHAFDSGLLEIMKQSNMEPNIVTKGAPDSASLINLEIIGLKLFEGPL